MGMRIPAIGFFLLTCSAGALFAQSSAATLSGTVTDPSGAAIVNAAVKLVNTETNVSQATITNHSGVYVFPTLSPAHYDLMCSSPGFREYSVKGIVLHVQDNVTLNVKLEVGSTSDTITVSADAVLLNTLDATVGAVVDRHIVENMPLNGRRFQGLITLTPGVSTIAAGSNAPGQFVANGQRSDSNYFTVDGVSANVAAPILGSINANGTGSTPTTTAGGGFNGMVSIDALQEFRISTSSFAPEFGRTPGAQVALTTRSGTNAYHGDVFEYLRNTDLDANDWFLNAQGKPRGVVRQNDFGAVVGGPIKKDKLFFFASYEGLRLTAPSPAVKPVPTQAARALAASTNDNGVMGYMAQFLNAYPLPDGNPSTPCTSATTCVANYTATEQGTSNLDAYSGRLDYAINSKMTLFGRYSHSPSSTTSATTVALTGLQAQNDVYTSGFLYSISPSVNNDLRFNFTHTTFVIEKNPLRLLRQPPQHFPHRLCPTSLKLRPQPDVDSVRQFRGGVDTFVLAPANANNGNDQINITEALSYVRGKHALKFGADWRQLNPSYDQSNFNWNNSFTGTNNCPGGTPAYICGLANLSNIQHNVPQHFQFREYPFFAQDTWKTSSKLTLTYGLRWEINPAGASTNGHPGFSVSDTNFNLNNLSNFTLNPFGAPIYPTRWRNISPRIGAAYQLSDNPSWGRVLRVGWASSTTPATRHSPSRATHTARASIINRWGRRPFPSRSIRAMRSLSRRRSLP